MPGNSPTAAELLEAVQEFLRADVLPALERRDRYHLQVALNALAIIARELELAQHLDEAERERLAGLVGAGGTLAEANRRLGARIRARELTHRDPALIEHLLTTTLGKMSIDNPGYATYLRALAASRPGERPGEPAAPTEPARPATK